MQHSYHNFLTQHRLPAEYLSWARRHFKPVLKSLSQQPGLRVLGINGCQGSGKSTLAAYLQVALAVEHGLHAVCLSMDDFYHTRQHRLQLALDIHPLLATRGVPGTHDVALALHTLAALLAGRPVRLPQFDKARDDRAPEHQWPRIEGKVDIILLEGWCLGAAPEPLSALARPVNTLEATEDAQGVWRAAANRALAGDYQTWFAQVQCWLMLKAPAFDAVLQWRWQQEQKLAEKLHIQPDKPIHDGQALQGLMDYAQTERFVQHYQRITEHLLATLPAKANFLYELDYHRHIIREHINAP